MNPLISIIVPVYNNQDYLAKCLSSCCHLSSNQVEVLIINDGSTDNSLKIIQDFISKAAHVRLINLNNNRGVGHTRNIGINKAKGRYILFLDADDWLHNDAINEFFNTIEEKKYEIIVFGFLKHYEGTKVSKAYLPNKQKIITGNEDTILNSAILTIDGLNPMVWCYLFSKTFLNKHKLFFPEGIYFEDVPFTLKALYYSKAYGIIQKPLYNYRKHINSITASYTKKKIDDSFKAHFMIRDFLEEKGVFEKYKKEFIIRLLSCCVSPCYADYFRMNRQKKDKELINFMKEVRSSNLLDKLNLDLLMGLFEEIEAEGKFSEALFFKKAYHFLFGIKYMYNFYSMILNLKLLFSKS